MDIILASASPRRREILQQFHIDFEVLSADIDETLQEDLPAHINAMRLAFRKGQSVYEQEKAKRQILVISADTIVYTEGKILGKPKDADEARRMIRSLSGRMHQVITGYALFGQNLRYLHYESTKVWFRSLSVDEIEEYIQTKEPYDKAGGYGIQGLGGLLADRIEGDYANVVGLPIAKIYEVLRRRYGLNLMDYSTGEESDGV
ncbi:MAG: Maf family protein [Peptostreptococcaceae bacterium]|nr:Maf family protein [Peptostreptococcaceae bacterium]